MGYVMHTVGQSGGHAMYFDEIMHGLHEWILVQAVSCPKYTILLEACTAGVCDKRKDEKRESVAYMLKLCLLFLDLSC